MMMDDGNDYGDDDDDDEKVLGSGQTSRKMSLAGEWRNQVIV